MRDAGPLFQFSPCAGPLPVPGLPCSGDGGGGPPQVPACRADADCAASKAEPDRQAPSCPTCNAGGRATAVADGAAGFRPGRGRGWSGSGCGGPARRRGLAGPHPRIRAGRTGLPPTPARSAVAIRKVTQSDPSCRAPGVAVTSGREPAVDARRASWKRVGVCRGSGSGEDPRRGGGLYGPGFCRPGPAPTARRDMGEAGGRAGVVRPPAQP